MNLITNKVKSDDSFSKRRNKEANYLYYSTVKNYEKALIYYKDFVQFDSIYLENTNKNKEKSDWDKMRTPSTLTSSSSEESSEYENDEEKQSLKETRTTNINVNVRLIHSFNLEYRVRSFIIVFYV